MTRNTECRVEVGVRIQDPALVEKLSQILDLQLRDNINAREMRPDGSYQKVKPADGEPEVNGQMGMYDLLRGDWMPRPAYVPESVVPVHAEQEAPAEPLHPEEPTVPETVQPEQPEQQELVVPARPADGSSMTVEVVQPRRSWLDRLLGKFGI